MSARPTLSAAPRPAKRPSFYTTAQTEDDSGLHHYQYGFQVSPDATIKDCREFAALATATVAGDIAEAMGDDHADADRMWLWSLALQAANAAIEAANSGEAKP